MAKFGWSTVRWAKISQVVALLRITRPRLCSTLHTHSGPHRLWSAIPAHELLAKRTAVSEGATMQLPVYRLRRIPLPRSRVNSYPWIGPGCLTPSRAITSCAYRFYGSTVYRRRPSGILVAPTVVRSPEGDTVHKRKTRERQPGGLGPGCTAGRLARGGRRSGVPRHSPTRGTSSSARSKRLRKQNAHERE